MTEPPRHPAVRTASAPRHAGAKPGPPRQSPSDASRSSRSASRPSVRASVGASGRPAELPSAAPGRPGRLQSVLGALPFAMLLLGLLVFYLGEHRQSAAAPIAAESVHIEGRYDGLSTIASGGDGRHYLWLLEAPDAAPVNEASQPSASTATDTADVEPRRRGVRVPPDAVDALREALALGDPIAIDAAPSVAGSTTRWLWRLQRAGIVVIDRGDSLR